MQIAGKKQTTTGIIRAACAAFAVCAIAYAALCAGAEQASAQEGQGAPALASTAASATSTTSSATNTTQASSASKKPALVLSRSNFTFSKSTCKYLTYKARAKTGKAADNAIRKVRSSKTSVATAAIKKINGVPYAVVTPKAAGKAKITCTDQYGQAKSVTITVKADYFAPNLKARSASYAYYGDRKITAYTAPNASVTLKISDETYTKKANSAGKVAFALKRYYKEGQKYQVAYKTSKAKVAKSAAFLAKPSCYFDPASSVWTDKKDVTAKAENVRKGDVLTVRCGSESHDYAITQNRAVLTRVFTMNKTMENYKKLDIVLKNKHGQAISSYTWDPIWK